MGKVKNRGKSWVGNWRELVNKSLHQSISELEDYLILKGLLVKGPPWATEKAFSLGYAKYSADGKLMWNLRKYIRMMQNDKKRAKREQKGIL